MKPSTVVIRDCIIGPIRWLSDVLLLRQEKLDRCYFELLPGLAASTPSLLDTRIVKFVTQRKPAEEQKASPLAVTSPPFQNFVGPTLQPSLHCLSMHPLSNRVSPLLLTPHHFSEGLNLSLSLILVPICLQHLHLRPTPPVAWQTFVLGICK